MSFSPSPCVPAGVRSIQEQRERWDRKRKRTGRELVQSEQRYCEKLDLITTYFVEILKAKGTLRQDIRESIFSSIKSIHLVNQTLLGHLEDGNFGVGFDQFCPHMHFYSTYVNNFHTAKKILAVQLKKNKAFRRFKKLQEARPEFHKLKLEDLLPLPLERIQQESGELRKESDDDDSRFPRTLAYQTALVFPSHVYCHDCPFKSHFGTRLSVPAIGRLQMEEDCSCLDLMEGEKEKKKRQREALRAEINVSCQCTSRYNNFLRDLTENTSPDNPEFQQLSKAVSAVSEVAQCIQDNARSHENHLQLQRVQKLLKGRNTRLLAPGRWYIREGWLNTVPPKGTETKPKMFFLFSDILVQAKRCNPMHPTNGDKLSCQRVFPLKECTVDKVFGHTKSQGGLISLTFSKAKLLLMSSHQEDINDWYRSLCLAIGKLKTKNTVVHRREELLRPPLRAATHSQQSAPASSQTHSRKRAMENEQGTGSSTSNYRPAAGESACSTSKKIKLSEEPSGRSQESSGSSCVIL
ncbi:rho guanine nucleotide exchange factor 39 isoform X1 [Tachysurus ichikawai]